MAVRSAEQPWKACDYPQEEETDTAVALRKEEMVSIDAGEALSWPVGIRMPPKPAMNFPLFFSFPSSFLVQRKGLKERSRTFLYGKRF